MLSDPEPINLVLDFGAKSNDMAFDNATPLRNAIAEALYTPQRRAIYVPHGEYWCFNSTPIDVNGDGIEIFGDGRLGSRFNFSGSASSWMDLSNTSVHTFRDLWVRTEAANTTVFRISNAYDCVFDSVRISGTHSAVENKPNQFAFKLLNNAGNNEFRSVKISQVGVGYLADTSSNKIIGRDIGGCQKSIRCTNGQGTLFITDVEFSGSTTAGETQVHLDIVNADRLHVGYCWFEGVDNAGIIGASDLSTGVQSSFALVKSYVQSRNTNLVLHKARRTSLEELTFTDAIGGSPTTPLSINATGCPKGYVKNLESNGANLNGYAASIPAAWVRVN
jgi:hypothetical protein